MKLSVACNFDEDLLEGLKPYPVYEIYGKLTSDYFGGGRPSFYLPEVNRSGLARYVERTHAAGIRFNYLLNALATGNREFTREGQREADELLTWLSDIGVDSVTVCHVYFLRLIKKRFPHFKVRVSAHQFTDSPRKVRFWVENGADYVVVSEVNLHRDFSRLRALAEAAGDTELQLIVNNWCRYDCAIAGTHAVGLNAASHKGGGGFPLDYCSVVCNELRLREPVNYLRANWIRPEDIALYEELGFHNFKIVERNTPTQILVERTKAYAERRYDGNLLDLVQNYAYPYEKLGPKAKDAYSFRRLVKYFARPRTVNLWRFRKVMEFGQALSVLYPLRGPNPVQVNNRDLDGFMERFKTEGCQDLDCEACQYCHDWAARAVKIDPDWRANTREILEGLLDDLDQGAFWEPYRQTIGDEARKLVG